MMRHESKYSRRRFLRTVGAGAALLPLLESDPVDAACAGAGIKRLFILVWPWGMLSGVTDWATQGDAPDAWTLPSFMASLAPYQKDLILLDGLDYAFLGDMPGTGDRSGQAAYPGMLTGAFYQTLSPSTTDDVAGGPSVDQYIGTQLKAGGYPGLVSLNLAAYFAGTGLLSWRGAGQVVLPTADPYAVFSSVFQGTPMAGTGPGGSGGTGSPSKPAMQRSVLDFVQAELKRFSQKVGTEDRQRIAKHLDAVRRIELGLSAAPTPGTGGAAGATGAAPSPTAGLGCGVPPGRFAPPVLPPAKGSVSVEATVKIHMDLAMAAFAADLTRVVVLQIGDQFANQLLLTSLGFTALGPNPPDANSGDFNGLHSIALRNGADKATCDAWFQSQVAYMTGQMKGLIDPNGQSALDNGVVLGMSNMRSGQKVTTQQVPTVLAGSGGGYFKTGRSLALTGAPNNQLLVSLCNAMGTPVATFGEPRYGGELAALKG